MIDFKRLSDMNFNADVFALSGDTLALCLSLVTTFPYRGQWTYDGIPVTDSQWDDIEAAVAFAYEELSDPYICPPAGGDTDYILQDEITLTSDATTITLTDLDLLSGRDLRIEIRTATADTSRRHLRVQLNGITASVYRVHVINWNTSATVNISTKTYFEMKDCVPREQTPQDYQGYICLDIPLWKDGIVYPLIQAGWQGQDYRGNGTCHLKQIEVIDTMTLFLSSGDFKSGAKIAVYSRGA